MRAHRLRPRFFVAMFGESARPGALRLRPAGAGTAGASAMAVFALLASALAATRPAVAAVDPGLQCERRAAVQLGSCVRRVSATARRCYLRTGAACAPGDARIAAALAALETRVMAACPDAAAVAAAGYGPLLTPAALVDRLQEACAGGTASLLARSFGGPHAAVLAAADADGRRCLERAASRGASLLQQAFREQSGCVRKARAGGMCDAASAGASVAAKEASAVTSIERACASLPALVGLGAGEFAARASGQARCMVATAHPDPAPLALDCGPRADVPALARATATRITLDESIFGTRCGDGGPYSFWIRLAPAGQPVERVMIHMQGGGVCVFESDCLGRNPNLFSSLDDGLPSGGHFSNTNVSNPLRDWTKVFLPYCTQDVHIGGGTTSDFPGITVHRFGALNVRAALRYVRDVLWRELDQTTPEGFRPDRLQVVLGGGSAGAFGTSYNYHYALDDLRWVHTTAAPDAGLGLDSGTPLGVASLGFVLLTELPPLGWGSLPYLPPYCLDSTCAVVPHLQATHSTRLEAVPEQQILNISNQVDNVQVSTTDFPSLTAWINELRASYCENQGLAGIHYFLSANPTSIHGMLTSNTHFYSQAAAGEVLASWLGGAVSAPGAVVDRVDEGSLSTIYGANPFACAVGSPSGAFLDGAALL